MGCLFVPAVDTSIPSVIPEVVYTRGVLTNFINILMGINPNDVPVVVITTLLAAINFTIVSVVRLWSVILLDHNDGAAAMILIRTVPTVLKTITFKLCRYNFPVVANIIVMIVFINNYRR